MTNNTSRINDFKIGDRVTPIANVKDYGAQGAALEVGRTYLVTGVHPISSTGGTLSLDGIANPDSSPHRWRWMPGSFGYAIFDKVAPPSITDASVEDLAAELRLRGFRGTLTREVTTVDTLEA